MRARAGLALATVAALTPGVAGYFPMALKLGPLSTSCRSVSAARPDLGRPSLVATRWPLKQEAAISALRASSAEEQPTAQKTRMNTDEQKIVQDFKIEGTGEGGRVTEEDVEKLVVDAEDLWDKALDARQQAEDLCTQAEDAATMSEEISTAAAQSIDESSPFSLKLVAKVSASLHALAVRAAGCRALIEITLTGAMRSGQGKQATEASMKAADLLVQAASMAQKADLLELEAEAALLKSELGIEQHLLDFPDADVA